jgi:hypothetical protein
MQPVLYSVQHALCLCGMQQASRTFTNLLHLLVVLHDGRVAGAGAVGVRCGCVVLWWEREEACEAVSGPVGGFVSRAVGAGGLCRAVESWKSGLGWMLCCTQGN